MSTVGAHILKLISAYLSEDLSKQEFLDLQQWINANSENKQMFSEFLHIHKRTRRIALFQVIDKDKAWENITTKLENPMSSHSSKKEKKIISISKPWFKYTAAAILVGILASTYFFRDNIFNQSIEDNVMPEIVNTSTIEPGTDKATLTLEDGLVVSLEKGNTFQTQNASSNGEEIVYQSGETNSEEIVYNYLSIPRGGQFFINLSDGTKIWLNSESQLKYPVHFIKGEARTVELIYGEAYFDVSPSSEHNGAKFKVLNQSQEVEVIGTEFNVKAYKDESNVYTTLVEGKVAITNDFRRKNLLPSQQSNFDINSGKLTIAIVDVHNVTAWKHGVFSFIDMPLKDIMKVLSRWYDVEVVFENEELKSIQFVGALNKNQSIDEILSIMTSTTINSYEIKDKTITIK